MVRSPVMTCRQRIDSSNNGAVSFSCSEPQKQPWGEFAMFKDPDGNQFVLSSS